MHALLVDDDEDFRTLVSMALDQAGVEHTEVGDVAQAKEALAAAPGGTFDLILLDVEMPGASGWDMITELRECGNEIPVVFVTNRESTEERVKGLRLGADDYVVKPIECDELVARMEAVVRRRLALTPIEFGDIRLDLARRRVERAGKPVELSPREYDLVLALAQARGEVLSREDLLREVWDMDFDPGTNLLDVHVGRVRKKLDRHGRPAIETVRGVGFRLVRHAAEASS